MTEFEYKEVGADDGDVDGSRDGIVDGKILLDGVEVGSVNGNVDGIEEKEGKNVGDVVCSLRSDVCRVSFDSLLPPYPSKMLFVVRKCRLSSSSAKSTPMVAVTD